MRSNAGILAVVGLLAHTALAAPSAKNFIYIVPDGYGPASQTMARDYVSLIENGENPNAPISIQLAADKMVCEHISSFMPCC
jgi:alkaline phosphatase